MCDGYEGSILHGAPVVADGPTLVVAQSDPVHPNALRCLSSLDGGARWTRGDTLWGGPSGDACAAICGDRVLLAFEGGDTGARQHVLVVVARRTGGQTTPSRP